MRVARSAFAIALALLFTGCAPRPVVDPQGVSVIRSYRFDTTVPDPYPAWNPADYRLLVRTAAGFALLEEGRGRQTYFESGDNRDLHHPAWVNESLFVFGPAVNVIPIADGRVVPSAEGLTAVELILDGGQIGVRRTSFTGKGYRPRVDGDRVYAQVGDAMAVFDQSGAMTDLGLGFFPEPQTKKKGLAWQTTPVTEADHWTEMNGARGELVIRWRPGHTTQVPGGAQPRWTPEGHVVFTVIRADPNPERPWYAVGTDVYLVENEDTPPRLIAANARDPQPHPTQPLVAVTDADGGTRIVSTRLPQAPEQRITTIGEKPRWSHDGLRIVTEEGSRISTKKLAIQVLKLAPNPLP
jgi:hypothetical protein